MNILNRVTMQSLRKNRIRTIITIIGIMLSTALICAVTSAAASMLDYGKKCLIYQDGNWHGSAWINKTQLEEIESSPKVDEVCYTAMHTISEYRDSSGKTYNQVILPVSDNFVEMMSLRLESGRLPENSHELVVSSSVSRLFKGLSLGSEAEFYPATPDSSIENGRLTETGEKKAYTIVGILSEDNFGSAAMLTGIDPGETFSEYNSWFRMKDPSDVYDLMSDHKIKGETNDELLMFYGATIHADVLVVLMTIALIVIGLIAFGAYGLIHNAFSISISERTKQFGLLSSVGATKKQLRRMVIFEALVISAIAIPLGLILGLAGMSVTFRIIGSNFASLMHVPFSITLKVTPAALIAAVIMTVAIVLVSAWGPAEIATKLSAIDAIRQNKDIRNTRSLRRTPRITAKLFGLPGIMASKHFRCNKKRRRATIMSLFMSVVLFISASSFTMYLVEAAEYEYDGSGCDISFMTRENELSGNTPDEFLDIVKDTKNVTKAAYAKVYSDVIVIDDSCLTADAMKRFEPSEDSTHSIPFYAVFVNDDEFRTLLKKNGLSESKFMDPDAPLAVASDCKKYYDSIEEEYVNLDVLSVNEAEGYTTIIDPPVDDDTAWYEMYDTIRIPTDESGDNYTEIPKKDVTKKAEFNIGAVISSPPYYAYSDLSLILIYPCSAAERILPERSIQRNSYFVFSVMSSDHRTSFNELKHLLEENDTTGYTAIEDHAEDVEAARSVVMIVKVFSYGFIVLISLISAANVFNTITTNVNLRRREFAMLRSVGMSDKSINRMMNYECLLYGLRALMFGFPVSVLLSYVIYRVECDVFAISFHLPWLSVGIAVFSVFAVVFAAMLYSMSKIKKDNPIDALKNENI